MTAIPTSSTALSWSKTYSGNAMALNKGRRFTLQAINRLVYSPNTDRTGVNRVIIVSNNPRSSVGVNRAINSLYPKRPPVKRVIETPEQDTRPYSVPFNIDLPSNPRSFKRSINIGGRKVETDYFGFKVSRMPTQSNPRLVLRDIASEKGLYYGGPEITINPRKGKGQVGLTADLVTQNKLRDITQYNTLVSNYPKQKKDSLGEVMERSGMSGRKGVTLYRTKGQITNIPIHEAGHQVYKSLSEPEKDEWYSISPTSKAPSKYGSSNYKEDFAETFTAYIGKGAPISQERKNYMDKLAAKYNLPTKADFEETAKVPVEYRIEPSQSELSFVPEEEKKVSRQTRGYYTNPYDSKEYTVGDELNLRNVGEFNSKVKRRKGEQESTSYAGTEEEQEEELQSLYGGV